MTTTTFSGIREAALACESYPEDKEPRVWFVDKAVFQRYMSLIEPIKFGHGRRTRTPRVRAEIRTRQKAKLSRWKTRQK